MSTKSFYVDCVSHMTEPVWTVQEESKQRQREDEERRKEVSAKFQSTINDITMKMQEHHQRNQALRQENLE